MKSLLLTGILFFSLVSCEKNDNEKVQINGSWVENTHKTDTLIFDNQGTEGTFVLNRGYELRSGYVLPKYNSGAYFYKIKDDNINLNWSLSSTFPGTNYNFSYDAKNEQIKIGNFFVDSLSKTTMLTFSKTH